MKPPYLAPQLERILLFLIGGSSAATLNLALAYIGVDIFGFRSDLQQNSVNIATMEIGLVYSFFIYRAFVGKVKTWHSAQILRRQLPLYHLSAGAGILARSLLKVPLRQLLGVHYLLNITIGLLAGASITYVLSDRYVFTALSSESNS